MTWRRRLAFGGAGLVALVIATVAFGNWYIEREAEGLVFTEPDAVPRHTYAIVPGAMVSDDGTPSLALADRLDAARALFAVGKVDTIFVSGDARDRDEDGVMARWLVVHGVPATRIIRDGFGYRTRDTMENATRIGITDAVICTQAYHLPRSIAWARHVGIAGVGLRADPHWSGHGRGREMLARPVAMIELWLDR